jgi:hypothetical protein
MALSMMFVVLGCDPFYSEPPTEYGVDGLLYECCGATL